MPYIGVIQEIWVVDYTKFKVPLFMCKWDNGKTDVWIDDMGFPLVDLNNVAYKDEPFIKEEQEKHVFYV